MNVYPVFLNVSGRPCVVVGGGAIAARKAETLIDAGARVTVIGPRLAEEIEQWARDARVAVSRREYATGDLDGAFLAYAATDDESLHERIAADARAGGVLLNVVDRPRWCDFIVPSIARRGDLVVAVSTSGRSPAMARRVRQDIEQWLAPEYEEAIALFADLRQRLVERGWSFERRKQAFDRLLDRDFLGALRREGRGAALRMLTEVTGEPGAALPPDPER